MNGGCAGIEMFPGAFEPKAEPAPSPPPAAPPPAVAPPRTTVEITDVPLRAARIGATGDAAASLALVQREALASLPRDLQRMPRAALAKRLEGAVDRAGPKADPGQMAALASLLDEEAQTARAEALYARVKERAPIDTPLGWIARFALAERAERTPAAFRSLAESARSADERAAARVDQAIAAFDAGDYAQARDAATAALREGEVPSHGAIDVAALAIARLEEPFGPLDLPASTYASLAYHVGWNALDALDLAAAERAAKLLVERAPGALEAPAAAYVLAAVASLRGDATNAAAILERARATFTATGAWATRVRAERVKGGAPTDADIEAFVALTRKELPHPAATDAERDDEMRRRFVAAVDVCLGDPRVAAKLAPNARIEVTALTYPDRLAEVRGSSPEAAACFESRAGAFFTFAPASAHGFAIVAR